MAGPGDRESSEDKGLSSLAQGYRKAAPYMGASTTLVAAVGVFTAVGIWVDRKVGTEVPWFTILGAVLGMAGGFISFFKQVLGSSRKRNGS
ncbi:AtpZ/AtpI family protein [Anaeromyxobacter sp. Fw109-5]|uniref:AtpZ/AtpI family protein n=1 Tax=Anaeromyxobacter sp. (strain Fw109-5) TaxID=404589 RepID=UPI0002E6B1A1|nr:AtpZ/AtpI family protein [Anaeromyxobacter sp. Fw109-5]